MSSPQEPAHVPRTSHVPAESKKAGQRNRLPPHKRNRPGKYNKNNQKQNKNTTGSSSDEWVMANAQPAHSTRKQFKFTCTVDGDKFQSERALFNSDNDSQSRPVPQTYHDARQYPTKPQEQPTVKEPASKHQDSKRNQLAQQHVASLGKALMPKETMIQPASAAGYVNVDAPPTAHAEVHSMEPDVIKFSNTEQLLASILQLLMSGHELEISAQIPDGGRAVKHELRVFPRPVGKQVVLDVSPAQEFRSAEKTPALLVIQRPLEDTTSDEYSPASASSTEDLASSPDVFPSSDQDFTPSDSEDIFTPSEKDSSYPASPIEALRDSTNIFTTSQNLSTPSDTEDISTTFENDCTISTSDSDDTRSASVEPEDRGSNVSTTNTSITGSQDHNACLESEDVEIIALDHLDAPILVPQDFAPRPNVDIFGRKRPTPIAAPIPAVNIFGQVKPSARPPPAPVAPPAPVITKPAHPATTAVKPQAEPKPILPQDSTVVAPVQIKPAMAVQVQAPQLQKATPVGPKIQPAVPMEIKPTQKATPVTADIKPTAPLQAAAGNSNKAARISDVKQPKSAKNRNQKNADGQAPKQQQNGQQHKSVQPQYPSQRSRNRDNYSAKPASAPVKLSARSYFTSAKAQFHPKDLGPLDPASVGCFINNLPPITNWKNLAAEIKGGPIHSIVLWHSTTEVPREVPVVKEVKRSDAEEEDDKEDEDEKEQSPKYKEPCESFDSEVESDFDDDSDDDSDSESSEPKMMTIMEKVVKAMATVYFVDEESADRFASYHETAHSKILGTGVVYRRVPPKLLTPLRRWHKTDTRALVIRDLPQDMSNTEISRWVHDQMIGSDSVFQRYVQQVTPNENRNSCHLVMVSVEDAILMKAAFNAAIASDPMRLRHVRVDFCQDPSSLVSL